MWFEFIVAVVIVLITGSLVNWYLRRAETRRSLWLSKELGVPDEYQWDEALMDRVEDGYFDALEQAEAEYCKANNIGPNDTLEKTWPSKLDQEGKTKIKMKLMERTMAWVFLYRKMEAELKRSQPLWRQNIISPTYWQSLKRAEEKLEKQFSLIKKEVAIIDPGSPTQTEIFRESCRIIDQYGYELVQGPGEAELVVYVPRDTTAKDLRVRVQRRQISVWRKGEIFFSHDLPEAACVRPDPNWQLARKGDFEVGDRVVLQGLTKPELNGQRGSVLKATKETTQKGRIRVDLKSGNPLSIKPINLVNEEDYRKCGIVMALEKEKKNTVWPMPPWNDGADDEGTPSTSA
eukprot:g19897.t1